MCSSVPARLEKGSACFYGITVALEHLFKQARAEGRDHYMIDNAFVDSCREIYFRVAKNRMQASGLGDGSPSRFASLKVEIKPWRTSGSFVLVCPQSEKFMQIHAGYTGAWGHDIAAKLKQYTDRPIHINGWQRDKARFYEALPARLKDCWALVTWSSAAANTATFLGVPAFVLGDDCIARPWLNTDIAQIESPKTDVDRQAFGAMLAKWQFQIRELRSGYAYAVANGDA